MSLYYATVGLTAEGEDAQEWLGEGPLSLSDVTDFCATHKVSAILRDAPGFVRGHVDADGNYRLT